LVSICSKFQGTVDGGNPAPVDMEKLPLFTGFYTSQVVQDFFHQPYYKWTCEHFNLLCLDMFAILDGGDFYLVWMPL